MEKSIKKDISATHSDITRTLKYSFMKTNSLLKRSSQIDNCKLKPLKQNKGLPSKPLYLKKQNE